MSSTDKARINAGVYNASMGYIFAGSATYNSIVWHSVELAVDTMSHNQPEGWDNFRSIYSSLLASLTQASFGLSYRMYNEVTQSFDELDGGRDFGTIVDTAKLLNLLVGVGRTMPEADHKRWWPVYLGPWTSKMPAHAKLYIDPRIEAEALDRFRKNEALAWEASGEDTNGLETLVGMCPTYGSVPVANGYCVRRVQLPADVPQNYQGPSGRPQIKVELQPSTSLQLHLWGCS